MREGGPTRNRPRLAETVSCVADNLDSVQEVVDGMIELQQGRRSPASDVAMLALQMKVADMLRVEREALVVVVRALERRAKRRAHRDTDGEVWLRRQLAALNDSTDNTQ